MVETTEDYLKNRDKYEGWFEIDSFTYDFTEQENKEALPLLRQVLSSNLSENEKREIGSTVEEVEDPEAYRGRIREEAQFLFGPKTNKQKLGRNDPMPLWLTNQIQEMLH